MPFNRCCVVLVAACTAWVSACDSSDTPISPTPAATPPVTAPAPGSGFPQGPVESGHAPAITIAVGDQIRATIDRSDEVCDPRHWDAQAPCKRFVLVAPTGGVLHATARIDLHGARPDAIDLMLIGGGTGIIDYSGGGEEQHVSGSVIAGGTYEVRVNSYPYYLPAPGALTFELRTELRTGS
jgi:hypothetical protein